MCKQKPAPQDEAQVRGAGCTTSPSIFLALTILTMTIIFFHINHYIYKYKA